MPVKERSERSLRWQNPRNRSSDRGGFRCAAGPDRGVVARPAGGSRPRPAPARTAGDQPADHARLAREIGRRRAPERREVQLGKRFAIDNQWRLPNRRVDRMVVKGRLVLSSHKGHTSGWRVASGREDAMIRRLAKKYRDYRREVVFIFHHEPHDDASDIKRGGRAVTSRDSWPPGGESIASSCGESPHERRRQCAFRVQRHRLTGGRR